MKSSQKSANLKPMSRAVAVCLLFAGFASGCSAGAPKGKPIHSGEPNPHAFTLARTVWKSLPRTKNQCGGYDYHPAGGMRSVYCHALSTTTFREVAALSGVAVFLKGPHGKASLDLKSSDFSSYNPEFVRRLPGILIPGKKDAVFRKATQAIYDRYLWKLARIHYVTYGKWRNNPALRRREIVAYKTYQRNQADANGASGKFRGAFYERFYYFMDPRYVPPKSGTPVWNRNLDPGEYDGNVVKTAAAFWLRRYMDGTAHEFHAGLKQLLTVYDGGWLTQQ